VVYILYCMWGFFFVDSFEKSPLKKPVTIPMFLTCSLWGGGRQTLPVLQHASPFFFCSYSQNLVWVCLQTYRVGMQHSHKEYDIRVMSLYARDPELYFTCGQSLYPNRSRYRKSKSDNKMVIYEFEESQLFNLVALCVNC